MNFIEIQKSDTPTIRWLQAGTTTESHRTALEGLNVEGDITVVANGFTLRVAPTPEPLKEFDGELVKLDKAPRVAGDVVKTSLISESEFPDWRGIIPSGKPEYTISLNGGLLAALIGEMGSVQLEFHAPTQPIIIRSAEMYAVFMPMHLADDSELFDPIELPELKESN